MPHSSTSDPSPRRRYSIVDRLGCFCPREPGSLSPVIFVTFESLLPPIPSNSIFFSFFGRKGAKGGRKSRQDNNTTTWNSNSQIIFPMELVSCFHPSRFFNRCPILLFAFSRYLFPSHRARKFPLLFPLNFCSRFVVVAKSFLPSRGCKGWMRRWRRPIISRREWPRISHFRRPLIEDRCTSRGSALYMDEGTTDHNDPPPRKHNGALALFSGTHCRPENHSAMTKCCVRAPANML